MDVVGDDQRTSHVSREGKADVDAAPLRSDPLLSVKVTHRVPSTNRGRCPEDRRLRDLPRVPSPTVLSLEPETVIGGPVGSDPEGHVGPYLSSKRL